ncbi:PilN domain-containing protein [Desulfovibrio sp. JC022]|uniref:PilN domain-containing protein n=1 Tax=Desulfovibrio sp. JC022 TaxID=2593642 RepID=UPI0013D03DF0|nr:PilN domain-containing protein [Desulfovibrio sp. JC022]NDV24932.1 PilN domain-containing protein [Desulfovibrio sp. JC022]
MSVERLAVDLSDGDLVLLGSVGKGKNLEYKESLVKRFGSDDPVDLVNEVAAYIVREEMNSPEIFIALDSRSVLLKSFYFPFRAAGKIEAALDFELERSLPIKREQLYVDWIFGPRVGKGTFISAGCVEDELLLNLKNVFAENGLRLSEIVEGVTPVMSLPGVLEGESKKLILDFGRERVGIFSLENGLLRNRDLILQGTESVIKLLEQSDLNFDAAYRLLFFTDFAQEELGSEAQAAIAALSRLIGQIFNYVQVYNEQSGFMPDLISICGEGAEITGIEGLIEKMLGVRTVKLLPHELLTLFEDNYEAGNALKAYGLLNLERKERLSFLAEEDKAYAASGSSKQVKYFAGWAAVLFLGFMVYFGANLYHKSSIVGRTEALTEKVFSENIPGAQRGFSHAQRVSILKTRIHELKRKLRNNSGGAGSAIEVLRVVHAAVNNGLTISFAELTLDPRRLSLSGLANNFKDVESLRIQLEKSGFFSAVSIKGAAAEKKTKKVRFTLELQRKPLEG